jgi:hypothetical protein
VAEVFELGYQPSGVRFVVAAGVPVGAQVVVGGPALHPVWGVGSPTANPVFDEDRHGRRHLRPIIVGYEALCMSPKLRVYRRIVKPVMIKVFEPVG